MNHQMPQLLFQKQKKRNKSLLTATEMYARFYKWMLLLWWLIKCVLTGDRKLYCIVATMTLTAAPVLLNNATVTAIQSIELECFRFHVKIYTELSVRMEWMERLHEFEDETKSTGKIYLSNLVCACVVLLLLFTAMQSLYIHILQLMNEWNVQHAISNSKTQKIWAKHNHQSEKVWVELSFDEIFW